MENLKDISSRVLKYGRPINPNLYTWNSKTRTFFSYVNNIVLDFKGINYCNFNVWSGCTFVTGHNCTFDTANNCSFTTGINCIVMYMAYNINKDNIKIYLIPNQKLIIDKDYNVYYDNPIIDIKYKKGLKP